LTKQADSDIDTITSTMADNDQLLDKIGNLIDQKLEPVKKDMATKQDIQRVEQGQARTNSRVDELATGQAHNTTLLEAVAAGQQELQKTAAREVTVMKLAEKLTRKVKDHEERIEELEKIEGILHPHKH
jgi:hypothetical protein